MIRTAIAFILATASLAVAAPYAPCLEAEDLPLYSPCLVAGVSQLTVAGPLDGQAIEAVAVPNYGPSGLSSVLICRVECGEPGLILAIAVPYQGNFFVYAQDGHAQGFGLSPSTDPGIISIFYFEEECVGPSDREWFVPVIELPLAGPIPSDCPIDAWIFTTPRGMSQAQATEMIAASYAVEP